MESSPPTAFDYRTFERTADAVVERFDARTKAIGELAHSSILFSDGLCICALCEMFGVEILIEAGTGCGGSTEMFARHFDLSRCQIISIDLAYSGFSARLRSWLRIRDHRVFSTRWAQAIAREKLARFPHVRLVYGDALRALPRLVRRLLPTRKHIGIFIDGPKQTPQLALAHACLELSPFVRFAALDDIGPMYDDEQRYARFRASPYAAFATSDTEFFSRYSWINAGRLPERMRDDPNHRGYGVGVLVNR